MRIGFLLGAGVSLPAGMPSTRNLTEAVFSVDNYVLHSDQSFVKARPGLLDHFPSETPRPALKEFLGMIKEECQAYFDSEENGRTVNYENLFYVASQVHEHILQEYENPAIERFAKSVSQRLNVNHQLNRQQLGTLAELAGNYIHDVVAIELSCKTTNWNT